MPKVRYVGPIVGVDVVAAGLSDVKPGDEFEVDDEAAAQLLADDSMYVPADDDAPAIADELQAARDAADDAQEG